MRRVFEVIAATLMILGIILAFFYIQMGGFLVGLAFGLFFSDEIQDYFLKAPGYYSLAGLFKSLMILGVILYLLISAWAFLIATVLGFVIMTLLQMRRIKR